MVDRLQELVTSALSDQQSLTAAELFSQRHQDADSHLHQGFYRDLIPLSAPGPGEQYAFVVDMDACSGCKSCVAACNQLNGVEEQWREVGILSLANGGEYSVTTACHHCVDPGCMKGCPVNAYEKDDETGIVFHLDDQCIGCKYCTMTCPYDVPKYSESLGVVRKCDMCRQRLSHDEAPACVQACPNQAIRIETVSKQAIASEHGDDVALTPGAPLSKITNPTTRFHGAESIRMPVQAGHLEEAHVPLAVLLALTGAAIGAQCFALASDGLTLLHAAAVWGLMVCGLGIGTLHLGRPLLAFRSVVGLRTSWLSREFVVFGLFAALLTTQVLLREQVALATLVALQWCAAAVGVAGLFCSVMIYVVTGRDGWTFPWTAARFFLGGATLGAATHGIFANDPAICFVGACGAVLLVWLELAKQASFLRSTPSRRRHVLLCNSRGSVYWRAIAIGRIGSAALLAFGLGQMAIACVGGALLLATECLDRCMFFMASVPNRMPGGEQ